MEKREKPNLIAIDTYNVIFFFANISILKKRNQFSLYIFAVGSEITHGMFFLLFLLTSKYISTLLTLRYAALNKVL